MNQSIALSTLLAVSVYATPTLDLRNKTVQFDISQSQRVQIQAVDLLGHISPLFDSFLNSGEHSIQLQNTDLYPLFYYLIADGKKQAINLSNTVALDKLNFNNMSLSSNPFTSLTSYPLNIDNSLSLFPTSNQPISILAEEGFAQFVDISDFNGDGRKDIVLSSRKKLGFNEEQFASSTFDGANTLGGAWVLSLNNDLTQNGEIYYLDKDLTGKPKISGYFSQLGGTLRPYAIKSRSSTNSVEYSAFVPSVERVRLLRAIPGGNRYIFTYRYSKYDASVGKYGPLYTLFNTSLEEYVKSSENSNFIVDIDYNGTITNIQGDPSKLQLLGSDKTCQYFIGNPTHLTSACMVYPENAKGLTWVDKDGNNQPVKPVDPNLPMTYDASAFFSPIQSLIPTNGECYMSTSNQTPITSGSTINGKFSNYTSVYYPGGLKVPVDGASLLALIKTTNSTSSDPFFKMNGANSLSISAIGSLGDVNNDGSEDFLSNGINGYPFVFGLESSWSTSELTAAPVKSIGCLSFSAGKCIPSADNYAMEILGDIDGNGRKEIAMWKRTETMPNSGFSVYEIQNPSNGIYELKKLGSYTAGTSNYPMVGGANQPQFVKNFNGQILVGIQKMYNSGADYRTHLFVFDKNWTPSPRTNLTVDYDILANQINNPSKWELFNPDQTHSSFPLGSDGLLTIPATSKPVDGAYNTNSRWVTTTNLGVGGLKVLTGSDKTPGLEISISAEDITNSINCNLNYCGNLQIFFNLGGKLFAYQVGQLELTNLLNTEVKTFHIGLNELVRSALNKGIPTLARPITQDDNLQVILMASETKIPIKIHSINLVEDGATEAAEKATVDCAGKPNWGLGAKYQGGEEVVNTFSNPNSTSTIKALFKCLPSPINDWCNNSAYEPGKEPYANTSWQNFYTWQEAWQIIGTCK